MATLKRKPKEDVGTAEGKKEEKGAPVEATEASASNPQSKLLIIIVILLIILIGTAGGIGFVLLKSSHKTAEVHKEEKKVEHAEKSKKDEKPEAEKEIKPAIYYTIEPAFVVTFDDPNTNKNTYLRIQLVLLARDEKAISGVEAQMPRIKNDMLIMLATSKPARIITIEGKQELRKKSLTLINKILEENKSPLVEEVLFGSFVMD